MSNKSLLFFTALVLAVAVVLGLALKFFLAFSFIDQAPSYWVHILLLVAFVTLSVYYVVEKTINREPTEFVRVFLMTVVLKIIVSGVVVFILAKWHPQGATSNAVFYLICYGAFTALEVIFLYIKKNRE